jgi:hypothetical protein
VFALSSAAGLRRFSGCPWPLVVCRSTTANREREGSSATDTQAHNEDLYLWPVHVCVCACSPAVGRGGAATARGPTRGGAAAAAAAGPAARGGGTARGRGRGRGAAFAVAVRGGRAARGRGGAANGAVRLAAGKDDATLEVRTDCVSGALLALCFIFCPFFSLALYTHAHSSLSLLSSPIAAVRCSGWTGCCPPFLSRPPRAVRRSCPALPSPCSSVRLGAVR